jgi:hypothetical protein
MLKVNPTYYSKPPVNPQEAPKDEADEEIDDRIGDSSHDGSGGRDDDTSGEAVLVFRCER